MQHPDEGTIHAWLDGALSAEEAAQVQAHVNECAQCQVVVAEARGFIAASSRILTALDNAPRGVIPATVTSRKVIAPWVWRIAATVMIVAAGTLVVVRKTGVNQSRLATATVEQTGATYDSSRSAESAAPTITPAPMARPAEVPSGQQGELPQARTAASSKIFPLSPRTPAPRAADKRSDATATAPSPILSAAAPQRFGGVTGNAPPPMAAGAADMGVAAENDLRIIGNRRAIGQKITLYEVASGDTVELAEQPEVQLNAAVVTGASAARSVAGQANVQTTQRATAKVSTPAADASAPPAAPPGPPPASATGMNTISWTDSSGRLIKLSGRHTPVELEQIRRRIEQLRQDARADSVKKNR